jgi:hypothetical protein
VGEGGADGSEVVVMTDGMTEGIAIVRVGGVGADENRVALAISPKVEVNHSISMRKSLKVVGKMAGLHSNGANGPLSNWIIKAGRQDVSHLEAGIYVTSVSKPPFPSSRIIRASE